MNAATAVLYDQRSKSSVTRAIRRWVARSTSTSASPVAAGDGVPTSPVGQPPHAGCRKRAAALDADALPVDVVLPAGPTNRWARRRASAPSRSKISSGATRLPFDFDIFDPPRRIMPWVNSRANGSRRSFGATPRSASALVKNRAYIRWRMACSMPPMYWSTGIQRSTACRRSNGASSFARVGEAQEVPGRVDEGVHGVGLAGGRPAARRGRSCAGSPRGSAAATRRWAGTRRRRGPAPAAGRRAPARRRGRRSRRSGSGSPRSAGG